MPQPECVELWIRLRSGRTRHWSNEIVDDCSDIRRLVDSKHPKAMIREVDVQLLVVFDRVEIPRRAEMRREASIDSQFIHDHSFAHAWNPLWITRSTVNSVKRFLLLDLFEISKKKREERKIENVAWRTDKGRRRERAAMRECEWTDGRMNEVFWLS